jgi:hypothetical protein
MDTQEIVKKTEEFNAKYQVLMEELLKTQNTDVIGASIVVGMRHLIQCMMLINFKKGGYLTLEEQQEVIDVVVKHVENQSYPVCLQQVEAAVPGWLDKTKRMKN